MLLLSAHQILGRAKSKWARGNPWLGFYPWLPPPEIGAEALTYGDIPGIPTANWGSGESCVEAELKRSRVPLVCAVFLVFVVVVGGSAIPQQHAATGRGVLQPQPGH